MGTDITQLLDQFIGFQTIEGNEEQMQECLDWVKETFFSDWKHQYHTGDVAGAPYAYYEHPEAKWLFFAHIDVVPADDSQFTLKQEDDILSGRGVKDMKGAQLPFYIAYKEMLEQGIDPKVSMLLTSDEETAGQTIPTLIDDGLVYAKLAYTPDSSKQAIITQHKGVIWCDLHIQGKGGHSGLPWQSHNPVEKIGAVLEKIRSSFPNGTGDDWQVTVTPTQLKGSDARNQIPNSITVGIDIRYPPQAGSHEEILESIRSVLSDDCVLEESIHAGSLLTDETHPFLQQFKDLVQEHIDDGISFDKEHGCTDARYFSERGIPSFLFGPEGGGLHAKDEWVSHSSLLSHIEFYRKLLSL